MEKSNFIDYIRIFCRSGHGGAGSRHFMRTKYNAMAGPDGGDGGRNALTREWALELRDYGIRANSVIVAECYTPMYEKWIQTLDNPKEKLANITEKIPLGQRMTTKEEIGDMVTFLLSPKSSHTTGQIIHVDGGYVHLDRAIS